MTQRTLEHIVGNIEFAYGMWDRFEITTGAVIELLKSLVCECRSVAEQASPIETESDIVLKRRVYDLVCALRDTWRAHVEMELANEERVH
jgi:hypothetical protein